MWPIPVTGPGPQIVIPSVATFGGSTGVADKYQEKIPSFSDNVTWIKGKHSMKYGMGFQQNLDTQLADVYTQYTFASINAICECEERRDSERRQPGAGLFESCGEHRAAGRCLSLGILELLWARHLAVEEKYSGDVWLALRPVPFAQLCCDRTLQRCGGCCGWKGTGLPRSERELCSARWYFVVSVSDDGCPFECRNVL